MATEESYPLPLVLATWRRPSFEPAWAWGVYVPDTSEPVPEARVLAVSSRLPIHFELPESMFDPWFDLAAGKAGPGPLTARTAALNKLKFRGLLRTGRGLAVPINVEVPGMGHDGTTYGFHWGMKYAYPKASLEWWEEGPKEWRAFTRWVVELQEFLGKSVGE